MRSLRQAAVVTWLRCPITRHPANRQKHRRVETSPVTWTFHRTAFRTRITFKITFKFVTLATRKNTWRLNSGVARICCEEGQSWKLGHGALTANFRVGAAAVRWLMQYWSKELWVVDICISWSRRLHNIWIVGCKIYCKVN